MDRRAQPKKAKADTKRSLVRKSPKGDGARVRDLQKRLAESLDREAAAFEQQAATAEILKVISRSAFDLQQVLRTVLESAARLCAAEWGVIFRPDGEGYRAAAVHGGSPEFNEFVTRTVIPAGRGSTVGRAALEGRTVQIADVLADAEYQVTEWQRVGGFRTVLAVPMVREGMLLGVFGLHRDAVRPFTDDQMRLVATFADQAAIAIENVRLFNELDARNRDLTATSEILQVISRSPTNVQPVFEAIAESAARLTNALYGVTFVAADNQLGLAAVHLPGGENREQFARAYPIPLDDRTLATRIARDGVIANIADIESDPSVPEPQRERARMLGARALLFVPMLRDGRTVGMVVAARAEAGAFTDQQVAVLETFANQAVIAIENVRLFTELQTSNRDLTTALDTQTATSDILRVISGSRTDVQPVFDAIVHSAVRLLHAYASLLTTVDGGQITLAAMTSTDAAGDAFQRSLYPMPVDSDHAHARAIRARAPFNSADALVDTRLPETMRIAARTRGFRSGVVVPMLRHGEAIGTIGVTKREPGGFTDDEIGLLRTFADQAVIAIENARLLTELQDRNVALTEANARVTETLEQQTATSGILRVISRSPTDVQPVFDTIADSVMRLCDAWSAAVYPFDGELVHVAAARGGLPDSATYLKERYPMRPTPDAPSLVVRAIVERTIVHVPDAELDDRPGSRETGRARGYRAAIGVPMLRGGEPIGAIGVSRVEPGPFSTAQIDVVKTFADQAVIAIENVRLFTELQASNRELTTALDTQTATADILRVISGARTDVQPVFDAIVQSAVRLLGGNSGMLARVVGDELQLAAQTSTDAAGDAAQSAFFPMSLHRPGMVSLLAIRERAPINIADAQSDPRMSEASRAVARARGARSRVVVPLLRYDDAIGVIAVARHEVGGFADDEIALLQTFADQAVIAIENARLLTELQARTQELTRSVDQLTALADVGRAVSSSLDLDTVLSTIVGRAVQLSGTDGGTIFEYNESTEEFAARATLTADEDQSALLRTTRLRRGEGAVGQMAMTREPFQIPDIAAAGAYESRIREAMLGSGTRSVLAIPLLHEDRLVGGLVVTRRAAGAFTDEVVALLRTFATQSALAIQNARLFRELEIKSRELEVASQHKSEFLASMSHELRTPLNAIIGYSELLEEEAGDLDAGRLVPDLQKIAAAAQHQLSLINDILDLSKIEAGRMELELTAFALPGAIDDALLLMRERATRRGLTLECTVDERLGEIRADQRKVKQVLLNLLSNAVKFTPESGRVEVRAVPVDGAAEISVTDTGIGIAPEDQEAVFEEFKQVGRADRKAEGTGLGLALCRKFVELHGGRIWVTSQVGQGSSFTFTLPTPRES